MYSIIALDYPIGVRGHGEKAGALTDESTQTAPTVSCPKSMRC